MPCRCRRAVLPVPRTWHVAHPVVVRLRPVTESRSARLADIAAQADVSEATVSRVLNDRPGVSDETRQAVLTAIDVLGYDRPTRLQAEVGPARRPGRCPSWSTRSSRRSRRSSRPRWPRRGSRRCCAPRPRAGCTRTTTCRCCSTAACPGSSSLRPARRRHRRPGRYQGLRERGLPIVLVNGWLAGVDAPFVSNDDVASMRPGRQPPGAAGPQPRSGWPSGPERLHPGDPQGAGLPGSRCASSSASSRPASSGWSRTPCSAVEGGAAAAGRLVSTRRHGGDLRVGPDGPRRHPAGALDGPAGAARRLRGRLRRLAR